MTWRRVGTLALRYPWVSATVVVGLTALVLTATPASPVVRWIESAFAVLVAARSAVAMVRSLRSGSWGIDILAVAAIASTVALGDYWAALVVVLMLTGGEALEDYAAHRARSELSALLKRAPVMAHAARGDIPVDAVSVGDELEVRPGEVVPVDGIILSDRASFDESSITGESLPVTRVGGDTVLSGVVNGGALVRLRAAATAADSQYQTIVDLVRSAADSKAPFVRLADRVAAPFTLVAFAIGGIAWLVSGEPSRFAEVLVVATPCPLLIATPVAFIAGMSRSASEGVIVKGGGVLEQLARARSAAFDKTGTLTRGTPEVDRVEAVHGTDDDLVAAGAAVEEDSVHVLATAIVAESNRRGLPVLGAAGVTEVVAEGVRGTVAEHEVRAGKRSFVDPGADDTFPPLAPGETAVYVSRDGRLLGRIVLSDEVRPEASATLRRLRGLGIRRTVMLTGDAQETAERIAELTGVDEVRSALLPAGKVEAVSRLEPRPVMMVGDGVNDAPVLAAADVGIAMGARGATAASESADAVILVEDIGRAADVMALAQRTIRIAYQSIGIGIGLSVALMLVATTGVLPAIIGASLQEVIDVIAILNSLRAGRRVLAARDARATDTPTAMARG
ncbi:heavy metal translocating P-type ATPase [Microbacteriaceae bacterium SG_E_30_P1]|uniref:Heavy metal translocating P-type ATPase n=1 Tax=Antiquaquibacter oligotrophicus TaxID=2880260 RepID=A0ABT6KQ17_9MICO|nr:heavy metal translocating P-type ATPase [Antiquaquibacter oligotrophicus]MDH6182077.1 heavy metal translocating P-type ATPase [Antiquaquibacter oligotrophicus]UDF12257.1 cadmium-translocating P-type ATPase [Antiquaquibacter oligotrophicus]